MCTYVNEPEVKVCKRTPAVKLPARGLNSAPLIAYPDGRVGSKKIVGKGKKNEGNKHRKLYRRKAERRRDKRRQKRQKDGKEEGIAS